MKKFLVLFALIISTNVFGEDISNFEIEGLSLGDSLLNSYKKDYILNNSDDYYGTDVLHFNVPEFDFKSNTGYDTIQMAFLKNDNDYKIIQIAGAIFYDTKNKNIDSCKIKKEEIVNELQIELNIVFEDRSFSNDEGNYFIKTKEYENGDLIRVFCTDWNSKTEKKYGWYDSLRIELVTDNALRLMGF